MHWDWCRGKTRFSGYLYAVCTVFKLEVYCMIFGEWKMVGSLVLTHWGLLGISAGVAYLQAYQDPKKHTKWSDPKQGMKSCKCTLKLLLTLSEVLEFTRALMCNPLAPRTDRMDICTIYITLCSHNMSLKQLVNCTPYTYCTPYT